MPRPEEVYIASSCNGEVLKVNDNSEITTSVPTGSRSEKWMIYDKVTTITSCYNKQVLTFVPDNTKPKIKMAHIDQSNENQMWVIDHEKGTIISQGRERFQFVPSLNTRQEKRNTFCSVKLRNQIQPLTRWIIVPANSEGSNLVQNMHRSLKLLNELWKLSNGEQPESVHRNIYF